MMIMIVEAAGVEVADITTEDTVMVVIVTDVTLFRLSGDWEPGRICRNGTRSDSTWQQSGKLRQTYERRIP